MDHKKCNTCLLSKTIDQFSKNKSRKDGLQESCKECCSLYHKAYIRKRGQVKIVDSLDGEIWVPVPEFEEFYLASNYSRIKSLPNRSRLFREKILKQCKNSHGYLIVTLVKDGFRFTCTTHILFGTLFVPNPDSLPVLNHKNGKKDDPSINNLEWTTYKGNTSHAFANGLMDCIIGENSHLSKLKNEDMICISRSVLPNKELAEIYGVTPENISLIKTGKNCSFITGVKYVRKKVK